MKDSVKENLIAAKALIDTPEKWIKGSFERYGCFCAVGAVEHVCVRNGDYEETIDAIYAAEPNHAVMGFNDNPITTHSDIMALFDRAIESAS